MGLIFSWRGNFLHCKHRSWKSNIPLWQQWGEVMNNLRFYALASPSLRKQSVYCLGRQFENMFIAWFWQLEEGEEREEEEEGVEEVTPYCLLCHSHWRVTLIAGAISPGTAGAPEGSCGGEGHLLSLSCRGERWSFEISPVCSRSKIYSEIVSQSQFPKFFF